MFSKCFISIAALVFILSLGCGGESQEAAQSVSEKVEEGASDVAEAAKSVETSAREAAEDVGEKVTEELESYHTLIMDQIAHHQDRLNSFKETAKTLNNEELNKQVEAIQQKLDSARSMAEGLKTADPSSLEDHKAKLTAEMDDVKKQVEAAQTKLSELKPSVPKIP